MVFNFQKFANHLAHTKRNAPDYPYPAQGPVLLVTNDGGSDCEILMSCMFCCMDILSPCDVCINMSPANDSHALGGPNIGTTPHAHQALCHLWAPKNTFFLLVHILLFSSYIYYQRLSALQLSNRDVFHFSALLSDHYE